ncbi:hypothetical protein AVEN_154846-1 [Araneus ventricosus]|uniref:Uncharacterized protein n=1 Tax=Araneus ventricosus TaxID=182803 RepID=A0A4Y2BUP4_ARAVE|nr:hypothetical protein AVEN_154846-1 [Araneus ventricosus]
MDIDGKVPQSESFKDVNMTIVNMLSQEDIPISSLWDLELLGIRDPADLLSRGYGSKQLLNSKRWRGPTYMKDSIDKWPKSAVKVDEKEIEEEKRHSAVSANNIEFESITFQ